MPSDYLGSLSSSFWKSAFALFAAAVTSSPLIAAVMIVPMMSRAAPTCTTSGRSYGLPSADACWAVTQSAGNLGLPAGSFQTEARAPGTAPVPCSLSTISLPVAHLTNSHAASLFLELAAIERPQEVTLYGTEPLGPDGKTTTPVLSATVDLAGSSRLA